MKEKTYIVIALSITCAGAAALIIHAQQTQPKRPSSMTDCPMRQKQMAGMNERGDKAMGFLQAKATHHFILTSDGGVIQVEANDPRDTESREQIRMHLTHIARRFAEGDFDTPMFIHDGVPPGVPVMRAMKAAIEYKFENTENGGLVRMSTSEPKAQAAIHQFLRFQIQEHNTGDSLEVAIRPAK